MVELKIDSNFRILESKKIDSEQTEKYKEYRRKWNENPKGHIVEQFPIHIDLESTSCCNLKCIMCFQSFAPPEKGFMDFNLFKKIIDEGAEKGLCSCKLQYRGEPLLHPKIVEMVKYAKDKGILEVMFNTNATLLTEEMSRKLINAGIDKIICSIDGYTKEVYEKIRRGAKFESILNNIKTIQGLKKEMNSEKPIVRVQMVDTPENHHQIDEYKKFWSKIVEVVAIEDLQDYHNRTGKEYLVSRDFECQQLWQRIMVMWNGDITLCCGDLYGKLVLGNANKDSISKIWTSEKLNNFRKLHLNGESHKMKVCAECHYRNWYINNIK
jgi:radical SAM protein with 4Fe4S-binding SPASM domain